MLNLIRSGQAKWVATIFVIFLKALFEVQLYLLLLIAAAKTANHPILSTRVAPPLLQPRGGGAIMKRPPPLVFEAYK